MTAYKDNTTNTWRAVFRYSDLEGNVKQKQKRGFRTKKEALEYEQDFIANAKTDITMRFATLSHLYFDDMNSRLRDNTLKNKKAVVEKYIIPYFGQRGISDIKPVDIRKWQTKMMKEDLAESYLRYVHVQLSAILNFAVRFYDLAENPCTRAGSMGSSECEDVEFFTLNEFNAFAPNVKDKYQLIVKVLFWSGLRLGELMALTPGDISQIDNSLRVNKSYQRIKKEDIVTPPKTKSSIRTVPVPEKIIKELVAYINRQYELADNERIFTFAKSSLNKEMTRACIAMGIELRSPHDLRHSHASLLIHLGYDPMLIKERLGHDKIETTLNIYGHLYPNKHGEVATKLNQLL